ncbi:[LysW]-aminoadipate semialdehyde transaminase [subsurface metagenome]
MTRAAFQYMYDAEGNTYLDMRNNIPHVGHCHPRVVIAGERQMARLNTNTRYLYDELTSFSEHLLSKFPDSLNRVFLVNSGSAAVDLAIRLALDHTQKSKIAVLEHGYHGNTNTGIGISHYKYSGKGGQGKGKQVIQLSLPDVYRGKFNDPSSAGERYSREAISIIDEAGPGLAALIAEPVVGCGGQVPLAEGYLRHMYTFIRQQGGVCISDEVQTGFGRLGNFFWGFEMHNVTPDIVVLGKPMGNGHPLAAVVTTEDICSSFENRMEFFSSFGGNPVSCSIGQAVLQVIEDEKLQEKIFYYTSLRGIHYIRDQLFVFKEILQIPAVLSGKYCRFP